MRFRRERLDPLNAWAASSSIPLTVAPRDNEFILGLLLDLSITKTEGAGPAAYQDWPFRLLTGLQLGAADSPYLGIGTPDIRFLYWWHRLRTGGFNRLPAYPAGNQTFQYTLPVLFGVSPIKADGHLNYEDNSAGIRRESGLTLNVNWGANSATGANITVTAASLGLTLLIGILEKGDAIPSMRPNFITSTPAMASGLGLAMSDALSTNAIYRRTLIGITQGVSPNDNRTDGLAASAVSEIGIQKGAGDTIWRVKTWDAARSSQSGLLVADDNAAVAGAALSPGVPTVAASHNPGLTIIDWQSVLPSGRKTPYGVDMRRAPQQDIRIAYSVDVLPNTRIVEFQERYLPQSAS